MKNDIIVINQNLKISSGELFFRFARSGGKGGQNVNKVETKVELLFDLSNSASLSDQQRFLISHSLRHLIGADGVIHIISQQSRSQWKNREDAVRKFIALLQQALRPRKKRIKTKLPPGGKEKRLISKKIRGELKKSRRVSRLDL